VSVNKATNRNDNYNLNRCDKCEKQIEHPEDLCANPEKLDKLSRAMESMGSVKPVLYVWNECTNAYVAAIVTDKDSTTRAKVSHSMAKWVAARTMT
jgi:hypothetical protein